MDEIAAEIRNKLQRATTLLERLANGQSAPTEMAKSALEDLGKVVELLKNLEK